MTGAEIVALASAASVACAALGTWLGAKWQARKAEIESKAKVDAEAAAKRLSSNMVLTDTGPYPSIDKLCPAHERVELDRRCLSQTLHDALKSLEIVVRTEISKVREELVTLREHRAEHEARLMAVERDVGRMQGARK